MEDLKALTESVCRIAREAGHFLKEERKGFRREAVQEKHAHDYVSYVDKESEKRIVAALRALLPEAGFITEEGSALYHDEPYCWVVDPLDGTNNYSQGLPVFCVSIGLQYRGETLLGVVYAPYLNELYTAIRGKGAFLNNVPIHVSGKTELDRSVLATGFPYDKGIHPVNNIDNLSRILPHLRGIRRMGSAAYDLCGVAAGFLDGYWELGLKLWDVCAGVLIVQEAGGHVEPFREDRGIAILAGNAGIVEKMKEYIS